jgi:hypothetical protein
MVIIFVTGACVLLVCLIKAAFTQPVHNRYVDRPVPDERNWQDTFRKSMKP